MLKNTGLKQLCKSISLIWLVLILLLVISCKTGKDAASDRPNKHGKKISQYEQLQLTALFIDGNREKSLGNTDKAMGLFAQCIKRNPTYAPAMYEMARVFETRGQYDDAYVMASTAMKYEPDNEWYQLLVAGIQIKKREYSEAAKLLKHLAEKHPDTPDYLMDLANVFILAGKNGDAIKVYDDIEKHFGITEETSLQKENLYLQSGKVNKAITEIEKLSDAFPNEIKYMGILAELYISSGNDIKGMNMYEKIQKLNPGDPYVHLSLADYYLSKNMAEKSFDELQTAFASPDMDIDTKVRILLKYFDRSTHDPELKKQAYRLCELMTSAHPEEPKAWSMRGDFFYRDQRLQEAANAFRTVLGLDSSKYVVWSQLMIIESQLENYDTLQRESELALRLFPEQSELYLYNGFSNIQLQQYAKAAKVLDAGLDFAVDKEIILKLRINLGDAYYKLKDYDASFEAYEKALKIEPDNLYVLNNYSFYLAIHKRNLARAEVLSARLNELRTGVAKYQDTYAWVLFAQEKYEEARLWLEKALAGPDAPSTAILEHYGDVLFKLNEKDKALEYWQKALESGAHSDILMKKINDRNWYE